MEVKDHVFKLKLAVGGIFEGHLTCGKCNRTTVFRGAAIAPGATITCPCGKTRKKIAGADPRQAAATENAIRKAFRVR
jgi:hypothetical protein